MIRTLVGTAFVFVSSSLACAQDALTENTIQLSEQATVGQANIDVMEFLIGTWKGEGLGGTVEETWMPPSDGDMLGMFRLSQEGQPSFYELMTISEVAGSLELRVKHFSRELDGWEEKDKKITFRFVKAENGRVYFSGLTFEPKGDRLTMYLAMRGRDQTVREAVFTMNRIQPPKSSTDTSADH